MKSFLVAGAFVSVLLGAQAAAQTGKAAAPPSAPKSPSADFVFPGPADPLSAPLRAAVDALRTEALGAHVRFIASPAVEGRGLGSPGLDAALEYAATQLALAGVAPLSGADASDAGRTFFQMVPMREIREAGGSVDLERRAGETVQGRLFLSGVDVVVPPQPARNITAPVVFVGYGIREAAPARDDDRGLDVKRKVVAVREGLPPGEAWRTKELREKYAERDAEKHWAEKVKIAKALGAVTVLGIEGEEWTARLTGREKPATFAFRSVTEGPSAEPFVVRCSPAVLEVLLGAPPKPDEAPRALTGAFATLRATSAERLGLSRNVVGVLEGSDDRDFARARVPFVRFFGNFFPAYHEAGDVPGALDPAQVRRVARLGLATAWLIADRSGGGQASIRSAGSLSGLAEESPEERRLRGTAAPLLLRDVREGFLDVAAAAGPRRSSALLASNGMAHGDNYIGM